MDWVRDETPEEEDDHYFTPDGWGDPLSDPLGDLVGIIRKFAEIYRAAVSTPRNTNKTASSPIVHTFTPKSAHLRGPQVTWSYTDEVVPISSEPLTFITSPWGELQGAIQRTTEELEELAALYKNCPQHGDYFGKQCRSCWRERAKVDRRTSAVRRSQVTPSRPRYRRRL